MPCTSVTVQAPSLESASVVNLSGSGGENRAEISFEVDNPNDTTITATVEYTVDGSQTATEDVGVSPLASTTVTRSFTYSLGAGSGSMSSNLCADVVNTSQR